MHTFSIRVQPNASRNEIVGWLDDGSLKIRIQTPPQDGKANKALIAFLANELGVSKNQISIVRGETSRQKVIAIDQLSHTQLQRLPSRQ